MSCVLCFVCVWGGGGVCVCVCLFLSMLVKCMWFLASLFKSLEKCKIVMLMQKYVEVLIFVSYGPCEAFGSVNLAIVLQKIGPRIFFFYSLCFISNSLLISELVEPSLDHTALRGNTLWDQSKLQPSVIILWLIQTNILHSLCILEEVYCLKIRETS